MGKQTRGSSLNLVSAIVSRIANIIAGINLLWRPYATFDLPGRYAAAVIAHIRVLYQPIIVGNIKIVITVGS